MEWEIKNILLSNSREHSQVNKQNSVNSETIVATARTKSTQFFVLEGMRSEHTSFGAESFFTFW